MSAIRAETETEQPGKLPIPSSIRPTFTLLNAEGAFNPGLVTACALRIIPIFPRVYELLLQDSRRYDITKIRDNFFFEEREAVQLFASLCSLLFAALGPAFVGRRPSSLLDMLRQFSDYLPVLKAMDLIDEVPGPAR